jgi:tetratricopeptide (TPR) repeat protein
MWQANYNYGCVNYQMGNLSVAEEYLRRAIRIDASDANQFLYLGLIYFKEERLVEAAKRVEQAIARNPAGGGYHFTLGMIELRLGNLASARAEMQKELKYHPENVDRVSQTQTMFEQLKTGAP